jgi:hypothetical protein
MLEFVVPGHRTATRPIWAAINIGKIESHKPFVIHESSRSFQLSHELAVVLNLVINRLQQKTGTSL